MTRECARFDLDVEMVDAVDGKGLTPIEWNELVFDPQHNVMTKGEVGCALSHQKIYERMLAERIDAAFILEDDVVFSRDPRPFIAAAAAVDPGDSDIFLMTEDKKYIQNRTRNLGTIQFHPLIDGSGAYAYVITRSAAANLMKFFQPVRMSCDIWKHFILCGLVRVWVCGESYASVNSEKFPSGLEAERARVFADRERRRYARRFRAMIPRGNLVRYYLWKAFVKPFETIVRHEPMDAGAPRDCNRSQ